MGIWHREREREVANRKKKKRKEINNFFSNFIILESVKYYCWRFCRLIIMTCFNLLDIMFCHDESAFIIWYLYISELPRFSMQLFTGGCQVFRAAPQGPAAHPSGNAFLNLWSFFVNSNFQRDAWAISELPHSSL